MPTLKYSVQASIDGDMGKNGVNPITAYTSVDRPKTGEQTGLVINYYMTKQATYRKNAGYSDYVSPTVAIMAKQDGIELFRMQPWVPDIIRLKFGILGTNQ